jgi:hypothetical protein
MPVPFVDLEDLDTPPALPPQGGAGGTGGAGGSGGATGGSGGAAGTSASGGAPVSLLVLNDHSGDPRVGHLDFGVVDKFFYDGYCGCGNSDDPCTSNLQCCGDAMCIEGQCLVCIDPTTDEEQASALHCESSAQCCQNPSDVRRVCGPFTAATGPQFCQACRDRNVVAFDGNGDHRADFGECCDQSETLDVFNGPDGPVCSTGCRRDNESCNTVEDCCPGADGCSNGTCTRVK